MSCCPEAPPIVVTSDSPPSDGPEQDLRPGESIECYSKRAGNSEGAHDDGVDPLKNKIENNSVFTNCKAEVSIQFKLTPNSDATGITWAISGDPLPAGVTFTSAGLLSGTYPDAELGKKRTYTVTATFTAADSTSDERTYSFAPDKCTGSNSIQFETPLVNGLINSIFGLRQLAGEPKARMHNGVDMVMETKGVHGDIVAAADGEVIKARNTDPNGYGNAIHIRHLNGEGKHLCTTTYNHLYKMLVQEGQKVSAGQKIALEGGVAGDVGSGSSRGMHLHFECKLPDGSFTDPEPFLRKTHRVATQQFSRGTPDLSTVRTLQPSGAAVTPSDVAARTSCPPTSSYPQDPSRSETSLLAPPGGSTDPFELAWFFTMKYEVGAHWNVAPGSVPSDPEIVSGACDTPAQKKKCGYVKWETATGGETKFGITAAAQPRTSIKEMPYEDAKKLGYSNYWMRSKITPNAIPAYLGVFMFDTNYNHGDGNGKLIYTTAGLSSGPWTDKASQMADLEKLYNRRLEFANSLKVESIRKGVAARVTACYNYVKGLTLA
jgi:murein DD-endopeptidase MepM/ murein hydrolase activator NlpD